MPRCEKCVGGHEMKECVVSWRKLCVSCGGANGAGDLRCQVRERQIEVAGVPVVQNAKRQCRDNFTVLLQF